MKKFKKLIPALCMLLISAVMLGSSTYAWFAMNNQVTATGMEVKAASNTQYLVISSSTTLGTELNLTQDNMTKKGGTADANTANSVFPCAKAKKALTGVAIGEWYTANSTDFDNEAAETTNSDKMTNIKKLTGTTGANDDSMNNYWMTYTFYIGLATGSKEYTGNLKITNSATLASAVKAIIKVGDNEIELTSAKAEDTLTSITLNTAATTVTVILYVDGNDSTVKSSNTTQITGSLSLAFEITPTV